MSGHSAVTVVITGKIKPDKLGLARTALQAVIPEVIAKEPACHSVRLHEDPNDPCRLLIIEEWDSIEAFTGPHMQTPHQKAFFEQAQVFLDGDADFSFWCQTLAAP